MKKLLITLLALLLVFSFVGCTSANTDNNNNNNTNTKTSFGLNETATFSKLKVTANEIQESMGSSFLRPDNGNVFVGVKFTVENISDEEQAISSLLLFEAYADDVKCNLSISAATAFSEGTLDGSIAAGKKLVGWYAIEVPASWKSIELEFKPDVLSKKAATFAFTDKDCTHVDPDSGSGDTTNPPADTASGLNETATLSKLKITATELKESKGESIFKPENGNVFVGIKFTIENTSGEEQSVSSLLQFTAYVDDVKCSYSFSAVSAFPDGTVDGTIAAGKKLVGWYAVEAPENWTSIEIAFQEDLFSSTAVRFEVAK